MFLDVANLMLVVDQKLREGRTNRVGEIVVVVQTIVLCRYLCGASEDVGMEDEALGRLEDRWLGDVDRKTILQIPSHRGNLSSANMNVTLRIPRN